MASILMTILSSYVMNRKGTFLFNLRKIYCVNNPKVNSACIDEYTFETLPKDKAFQKKYSLLDRYI
jgi:hypothetical protein